MLNNGTELYELKEIQQTLDRIYKEKRVENILNVLDRLRQENLVTPEDYNEIIINAAKTYNILK